MLLKLYALSAFLFLTMGAAYDMPKTCFSAKIARCYAVQADAWVGRYPVNWASVDFARTIR